MSIINKIDIQKIVVGLLKTNCYIVSNDNSAVIIDPGAEANKIVNSLGNKKLLAILLTHGHFDHIGAVDEICNKYNIPVYLHEKDSNMLINSFENGSKDFTDMAFIVNYKPNKIKDGDVLKFDKMEFKVLHTPGHTRGGVCYFIKTNTQNICFTGDTLFNGGYGRTDFFGGSFTQLKNSLRKLFNLDEEYLCYTGHGAETKTGAMNINGEKA